MKTTNITLGEFEKYDVGDLVRFWSGNLQRNRTGQDTMIGIVTAIRTHETPILPEKKIGMNVRYANPTITKYYDALNVGVLANMEILQKAQK